MKKISKRIISILISALLTAMLCLQVSATSIGIEETSYMSEARYDFNFNNLDEWQYDNTVKAAALSNSHFISSQSMTADILNSSARSTSKPTIFWDLSSKQYKASLVEVSCVKPLYTNYYFNCNDNRELYVDYSLYSKTGREVKCTIRLYDLDKKTYLDWDTDYFSNVDEPASSEGPFTGGMYFYNIDIGTRYAIAFLSNKHPSSASWDMLCGSATIHH